jgi:ribosomal protein S4
MEFVVSGQDAVRHRRSWRARRRRSGVLDVDIEALSARLVRLPEWSEISVVCDEWLVVEFYCRCRPSSSPESLR